MSNISIYSKFVILFCFCWSCNTLAQVEADTFLVRRWIDSAWDMRIEDPQRTLILAQKALANSPAEFYFGNVNALQLYGESYYGLGKMDSALYFYHLALHASRLAHDNYETGNNYSSLASIFLTTGRKDSSLYYYELAIDLFETSKDSSSLSDALLRYGNVHNDMGHHAQAIEAYLASIRICESIGKELYIAYNYGAIGTVHDKQGNYEQAKKYFLQAKEVFQKLDDWYGLMGVYNNLGILYKNQEKYDEALEAYNQSLVYSDSIAFAPGQLSAHTNLGILHTQLKQFELALHHSSIGLELSYTFEDKDAIGDNLNWMAQAQLGLKDYTTALNNANAALEIGYEAESLERQRDALLTLSEIYAETHRYAESLDMFKQYSAIKDSLFNISKTKQMDEILTLYETEKKDNEIALLAKKTEIDRIKKTRLWIAFGLSVLIGGLLLYLQWVRRSRDRKIHAQEKELEVRRRRTAELENEKITRELDFKKQELAAKALQLARKNEFLQSVHQQVEQLRQHSTSDVEHTTRQISRQIRRDIESEEEWEQFLSSFREVHRDFIDELQKTYPSLTKGEIRLACLMKMNLSGKELASMLNISYEGIKKARHRMRKKLNLDSEIDIQDYMLSFPVV